MCSPPARGWTESPRFSCLAPSVFPARAGMDRSVPSVRSAGSRVPRPRGDGPARYSSGRCRSPCSPPARGWTPARAGMDRRPRRRRSHSTCVPRPRGDGPEAVGNTVGLFRCSPPARGWTGRVLGRVSADPVFPARAGMDRTRAYETTTRPCVPRPRGDGPLDELNPMTKRSCSPPARGWTEDLSPIHRVRVVFPARAGMDRSGPERNHRPRGVPRPRGDGPASASVPPCSARCSPPARGWTGRLAVNQHWCRVFPARAGMDRGGAAFESATMGVPRPRGDGPPR